MHRKMQKNTVCKIFWNYERQIEQKNKTRFGEVSEKRYAERMFRAKVLTKFRKIIIMKTRYCIGVSIRI